jgi:hypothetical protein
VYGASTTEPGTFMAMSVPELHDYERQTTSFDAFGWFRTGRYHLTAPGEPRFVPGAAVTPALTRQLGSPMLGQWFADDSSAVISSVLWRRLGGGRDIIGSAITLDERPYTVSGVMPPAFQLPVAFTAMTRGETEVWIPLDPPPPDASRGSRGYFAYARRKPGVSLEQADADAKRIATAIAANDPHAIGTTRRAWPACASRRSALPDVRILAPERVLNCSASTRSGAVSRDSATCSNESGEDRNPGCRRPYFFTLPPPGGSGFGGFVTRSSFREVSSSGLVDICYHMSYEADDDLRAGIARARSAVVCPARTESRRVGRSRSARRVSRRATADSGAAVIHWNRPQWPKRHRESA